MLRSTLPLTALIVAAALLVTTDVSAQDASLVDITSNVTYDLDTEDGPVNVAWQVSVLNNDPATSSSGEDGSVVFYNSVSIPILRGAESITAVDEGGEELNISVDESSEFSIVSATIEFAERLFYEDTYRFDVRYEIAESREESILVTPAFMFLPIVASGDEATVTVVSPPEGEWESVLQAQDCEQDGATFFCSGSDGAYIAAVAEVSRPSAVSSLALQAEVEGQTLDINLTYFQGEEPSAEHLRELIPAALPVIEDVFGFAYDGPSTINIRQGGRYAVLGYEGITQCSAESCEIIISPVSDDITVIHELAHLWTDIYSERWLSEGFAQLIAEEAAAALPEGLVRSHPPARPADPVNLPLDQWGDVESIVGAAEEQIAIENAGYELSLRFLKTLQFEVGNSVLRDVNIAIAASGRQADSRSYMDLIEDTSNRNLDQLFLTWVFSSEYEGIIALRREARDRLSGLETRVLLEGLPEGATEGIREDILDWNFESALSRLASVEADIATYNELAEELGALTGEASSLGLTMPPGMSEALDSWEFGDVRLAMSDARDAIEAYRAARIKVFSDRNLWERFGLLGSDPEGELDRAAAEFAAGQFQTSIDTSRSAANTVDNAATVALRRVLIVTGIFAAFGLIILAAAWFSHIRDRQLADQ